MTAIDDSTPIIVGVGEASEQIGEPGYATLSPADLAGRAAKAALDDALSINALAGSIDTVAAIRQFENSTPRAVAPFGRSNNFPRSVAQRIGANPKRAILEITGGQGPQHLVNDFAGAIARGEIGMALLVGSEAISTMRDLLARNEKPDWSETVEGELEDRGYGMEGLAEPALGRHGGVAAMFYYALFENARRGRLGLDRLAYAKEMGRLFAPFTEAAAANPHAMSREVRSADELATVTPRNRLVADPYPRFMVSRDQANQGAAVLMTSVGKARTLGIPESKWVFLHGYADAYERSVLQRQDLSKGPASVLAAKRALESAGKSAGEIDIFDFYSCFPIAVFNIAEGLGIAFDDPRGLTITGGLPFFGGAGNNYSMHAIAEMAGRLRARPGAFGLVAANGGMLSKYSVGVYSTEPAPFVERSSKGLQAEIDGWDKPALAETPNGLARIETYTIDFAKPDALKAMIVGRLLSTNERFVATNDTGDGATVNEMLKREPLNAEVSVRSSDKNVNLFTFA
jgi:acetyl-CoA C-acetyltransferase